MTHWPPRCWLTGCTRSPRASSWVAPAASPRRGPRTPAAWSRSSTPSPSPCCLATTVELYDGLVARGIPGPGPPRRDPRHRQVRRDPCARRPAGRRCGAGRSGRRADRGPCRGAGGAHRRAERGRRRAAREHRHHRRPAGAGLGRRRGRRTGRPIPTCCTCSAPRPSATTTTGSSWRCNGAPTISAPRRPRRSAASGCGASAPGTSSSPPARTNAPSCSPTTTAPASCSPTARAPSCTATASRSANRPSSSPPTTAPTSPRSTCTTPACGSTQSSTPAPSGAAPARGVRRPRHHAADRIGGQRHAAARARITAALVVRPPISVRRRACWTVTCCSSAAAGIRPCTCSARYAASCATTTPSAPSYPASDLDGVSVVGCRQRSVRPAGMPAERT